MSKGYPCDSSVCTISLLGILYLYVPLHLRIQGGGGRGFSPPQIGQKSKILTLFSIFSEN